MAPARKQKDRIQRGIETLCRGEGQTSWSCLWAIRLLAWSPARRCQLAPRISSSYLPAGLFILFAVLIFHLAAATAASACDFPQTQQRLMLSAFSSPVCRSQIYSQTRMPSIPWWSVVLGDITHTPACTRYALVIEKQTMWEYCVK